jgi:hypothetical protein
MKTVFLRDGIVVAELDALGTCLTVGNSAFEVSGLAQARACMEEDGGYDEERNEQD